MEECLWKRDFTKKRFNWLMLILEEELDEQKYGDIQRILGEKCAETMQDVALENEGNPKGYFKAVNEHWGDVFNYNQEKQVVRINNQMKKCPCPNVQPGLTPKSYCDCSKGWQKYMFETVFKKPVKVTLENTILRGGSSCKFLIEICG